MNLFRIELIEVVRVPTVFSLDILSIHPWDRALFSVIVDNGKLAHLEVFFMRAPV